MVAKGPMKLFSLLLVVAVMSPQVQGQCILSTLLNTVCSIGITCDLGALLTTAGCGPSNTPLLAITSGNYTLNLQAGAQTSLNGLNISASGSAAVIVNINSALSLATNGLSVLGNALVNVAEGIVVDVAGDLNVAASAAVNVAGNVTVQGQAAIQGTLNLAGNAVAGAQTAWLVAKSVTVSGTASAAAQIIGNGGVDGSISFSGNANVGSSSSSSATTLTVTGDFNINSAAFVQLFGNATVSVATVSGTLKLAGTQVQSTTNWLVARSSIVSISGSDSATATVSGNGGIDGHVTCTGNVTLSAGNSPGTVWVNGNLDMSSTTTLQVDVDSSLNFDKYVITGKFNRNGILYVNFEGGYVPNDGQQFAFATHTSSSGSFNVVHGDFDSTFNKIHQQDNGLTTGFQYGSAVAVAVPILLIAFFVSTLIL